MCPYCRGIPSSDQCCSSSVGVPAGSWVSRVQHYTAMLSCCLSGSLGMWGAVPQCGVSDPGFWLTGEGVPLSPAKLNGSDSSKSLPSPSSSPQPDWIASPTHDPQWCPSDPTDSSLSSLFGEWVWRVSRAPHGELDGETGFWRAFHRIWILCAIWQNSH